MTEETPTHPDDMLPIISDERDYQKLMKEYKEWLEENK